MKLKIEKLVLPFSIGCASESSVALGFSHSKIKPDKQNAREEESPASSDAVNLKPNASSLRHRVFKNISQLFGYGEDDDEEKEIVMQIGLPTDVKHVAHIGWDGSSADHPFQGWDRDTSAASVSNSLRPPG